jgi:hypothetical protein
MGPMAVWQCGSVACVAVSKVAVAIIDSTRVNYKKHTLTILTHFFFSTNFDQFLKKIIKKTLNFATKKHTFSLEKPKIKTKKIPGKT